MAGILPQPRVGREERPDRNRWTPLRPPTPVPCPWTRSAAGRSNTGSSDGFVLYSVDRDGVDDGGTAGSRSEGDLVWTATR